MKQIFSILMCIAAVTMMSACGGKTNKKATDGNAETKTESKTEAKTAKGSALFDIPKEKVQTYNTGDGTDLNLALKEIPSEIFKGVGELTSVYIMLSKYGIYKYDVILKFKAKSGMEAAKELADYYKSIGATVEQSAKTETSVNYKAKFGDWGESTEINGYSTYLNVQLNVVKNKRKLRR